MSSVNQAEKSTTRPQSASARPEFVVSKEVEEKLVAALKAATAQFPDALDQLITNHRFIAVKGSTAPTRTTTNLRSYRSAPTPSDTVPTGELTLNRRETNSGSPTSSKVLTTGGLSTLGTVSTGTEFGGSSTRRILTLDGRTIDTTFSPDTYDLKFDSSALTEETRRQIAECELWIRESAVFVEPASESGAGDRWDPSRWGDSSDAFDSSSEDA